MLLDDIKLVNKYTFAAPLEIIRKWFSEVYKGYRNVILALKRLKVLK